MYSLFIDDLRELEYIKPTNPEEWKIARSSSEAIETVLKFGVPEFISFDHDLGWNDTSMIFVKWWTEQFPVIPFPRYMIHSSNPIGAKNLESYMNSFNRSLEM